MADRRRTHAARKITRRKFMQYSAGAAALLGGGSLLSQPKAAAAAPKGNQRRLKSRFHVFNLSHVDTSRHDITLVAGKLRVKLKPVTPAVLKKARQDHPILHRVPDAHMTHHVTVDLPDDAIQLCYLRRADHGRKDRFWDMPLMFYHLPDSALLHARERALKQASDGRPPVHAKWERYGVTSAMLATLNDPIGEHALVDTSTSATSLVASHPELACGDKNSAAHIQQNIIGPKTGSLSHYLTNNPDTWATQTPIVNPDTGQQLTDSRDGTPLFMPIWSDTTGTQVGATIKPCLDSAKDDTTLGANITSVDSTTLPDYDPDAADNGPTGGKIWTLHDGMTSVDHSATSLALAETTPFPFQFTDQTPGHGYRLELDSVGFDQLGNRTITVRAKNWYCRYLSVYVRYLNGAGDPIPLSSIENEIKDSFDKWDWNGANGEFDAFVDLIEPEWVFLGIPLKDGELKKSKFPVPSSAASVLVLAGGLGSGPDHFSATVTPGKVMTIVFNLCVPAILLAFAAAAGYAGLTKSLEDSETLREVLAEGLEIMAPIIAGCTYSNPLEFKESALAVGEQLLSAGARKIDTLIAEAIAEGEAIEAMEDAIPIVGTFLSALWALSLAAALAETSAQVSASPQTYVDEVAFTHDIAVTIHHAPDDPAGFPATAATYTVTATFDSGSPRTITEDMPCTTVTAPIQVTFPGVPSGGLVKVDVAFYASDGYLVGHGSTKDASGNEASIPNSPALNPLPVSITIEEKLVPLTAQTVYFHKEIIQLDDATGAHKWVATTAPTNPTPAGFCDNVNGHICKWTGITVSTVNASVGYAWKAYNTAVHNCATGAVEQVFQFANISSTENPQSGYLVGPDCGGFSSATRMVYDLLGQHQWNFYLDPNGNYIRQIRLSPGGPTTYDSPSSNKAFGKLQFTSDALLLHPLGTIVSLNTSLNKIEILELPDAAVPDAQAPLSQVRSGKGTREGLMHGPIHAALASDSTLLILEQNNNRIQAFDLNGNPVPYFADKTKYFIPLKDPAGTATYLDLGLEYLGYLYVLSFTGSGTSLQYHLDVYTPNGDFLARTTGVNADKLAVNYWRDVFTLNYPVLTRNGAIPSRTEPSVSHWIPTSGFGPAQCPA